MKIPKVIVKPALVFAVGGLGFSLLAPVALFAGFSRFAGPILFGLFIAVVPLFLGAVLMIPNRSGGKAPTRAKAKGANVVPIPHLRETSAI